MSTPTEAEHAGISVMLGAFADMGESVKRHISDAVIDERPVRQGVRVFGAGLIGSQSPTAIVPTNPPDGPATGRIWNIRSCHLTGIVDAHTVVPNVTGVEFYCGGIESVSTSSQPVVANFADLLPGGTISTPAPANPVPTQPPVPATGVAQQNTNSYPVQVVISANGATITNVSVNGVTVGTAAGTYVVPAFGSISIAYSVATPTWVWSDANAAAVGTAAPFSATFSRHTVWANAHDTPYALVYGGTPGVQVFFLALVEEFRVCDVWRNKL